MATADLAILDEHVERKKLESLKQAKPGESRTGISASKKIIAQCARFYFLAGFFLLLAFFFAATNS